MSTYLVLVNNVLSRLREQTVSTVTETTYAQLIGKYINDAKRRVEDAYDWDCLETTITLATVAGTTNYTLTGSGRRQKNIVVNNSTSQAPVHNAPIQWIVDQQQLTNTTAAQPTYFAWNGWNGTDSKVEIWPTPDGVYSLKFNMNVPQVELSADGDILLVPSEPVVLGAYARAIAERGEDGGLASSEAYQLYTSSLSDAIAVESTRFVENDAWVVA
jgi:hypothetical protein